MADNQIYVEIDPSGKNKKNTQNNLINGEEFHWSKPLRLRWTITYFFGTFFIYCARTSMSVCSPAIAKEMGWSKQTSGMALSAFFVGYLSTNVLGGYLADRHGGEKMIILSATVWSGFTLLLPYLAERPTFLYSGTLAILGCRFFTGMAQGFYFPSLATVCAKHVPVKERAFITGFSYSGSPAGTILTGFAGSLIVDAFNWETVFIVIGVPALVWVYWMWYLFTSTTTTTSKDLQQQQQSPIMKPKESVPWMKLASTKPFWGLVIAYFCSGFVFFNLLSWTPVYFHDLFPESKGWIFNVVPWSVNFVLLNISSYYANILLNSGTSVTMLRKSYSAIFFLGGALFSFLLTMVETFKQALFVMSLNIGMHAFASCSINTNSQDLCPRHAGALHGLINSLSALAGTMGVYFTGYILETTGHWFSVYALTSFVSIIGFLGFQLLGSGEILDV